MKTLRTFLFLSFLPVLPLFASDKLSRRILAMQKEVWQEWTQRWQVESATASPAPFLPLPRPVADKPVTATLTWHVPDSLEPHAEWRMFHGTKGERPAAGFPCYLYLHGSGPSESEWHTGLVLANRFDDAPSLWFVPRIPNEGGWYRWWQRGKQWALQQLLRHVLASPDVDAARLYLLGISEGGYGSQRLSSFFADYLAAAGPMAGGEPLINAPAENLSHTAFSFLTGANDATFCRNLLTERTGQTLDSLARKYPGEYVHRVELIPHCGHGIDYSPTTPWLSRHRRTPQPRHFLWENFEMDGVKRNAFFNLEVLEETAEGRTAYEFTSHAETNELELKVWNVTYETAQSDSRWGIPLVFRRHLSPAPHGRLRVFLSPELADLSRPLRLSVNGKTLFRGKAKVEKRVMERAVALFGDPLRLFPAAVEVEW